MSFPDQQPARPRRRPSDPHEDYDRSVDPIDEPWFGDSTSGDPSPATNANGGDEQASRAQDNAARNDDQPEHYRVAGPRRFAEALWQFFAAVGNLLADSDDTLGHFFSQLGNLIGSLLEAHGDLD
jgi:hypothetical protein